MVMICRHDDNHEYHHHDMSPMCFHPGTPSGVPGQPAREAVRLISKPTGADLSRGTRGKGYPCWGEVVVFSNYPVFGFWVFKENIKKVVEICVACGQKGARWVTGLSLPTASPLVRRRRIVHKRTEPYYR